MERTKVEHNAVVIGGNGLNRDCQQYQRSRVIEVDLMTTPVVGPRDLVRERVQLVSQQYMYMYMHTRYQREEVEGCEPDRGARDAMSFQPLNN